MSPRFVLGLGGTVDYEVGWSAETLTGLAAQHGITVADLDATLPIADERDLLRTLLAFVRDGTGGERFVASSGVVAAFARRFDLRVTLGGTCVRAATAMSALGIATTVHLVSIDDTVRRLLPPSVSYVCSARRDSLDPHLVVQFPAGARVRTIDGEIVSPRPNRIIYVNDPANRELVLDERLGDELATADVALVSGLNTIQDPATLDRRLADLHRHLGRLPDGAFVYFEDAGYHVPAMARRVRDEIVDLTEVYAMNEEEMQGWLGRRVELLDPRDVARALGRLAQIVPAPVRVVHTRYWALADGRQAHRFRTALRGGIAMAGTRYAVGDDVTADAYSATAALPPRGDTAAFARTLESRLPSVVCEPGYDLAPRAPTTIGLGDAFVGGFLAALPCP